MLEKLIPYNKIEVITDAMVNNYQDGKLKLTLEDGPKEIECDSVILSIGYKEEKTLYQELEHEVPEIYLLGDARRVANIMYAIWDAFEVASHI